jgi:LPXTG-site transpeptidase (sortase) family protein
MKRIIFALLAVTFLSAGAWLFVSPSLERRNDIAEQSELLELLDEIVAVANDEGTTSPSALEIYEPSQPVHIYEETPLPEPAETYVTFLPYVPTPEPLDLSAFPQGIVPLGILTIDSIDLRLPVMEGVDEPELRIAPGRVPETARIGETGNAVIAGHRNFTFGSMFNRLGEVETGDIVQFQRLDGTVMDFEVFEILVIYPKDQIAFIQPQEQAIITLYTCTPTRIATHRLIIRAEKI